ncbi:MAG: VCBS repeat-containing protein, partial [Flavisolibacter sp.]|nr:VCBS repeat-containing protein [Flavisolibacter sp.]
MNVNAFSSFLGLLLLLTGCSSKKEMPLFEAKNHKQTGLNFTNQLTPTDSFNMFRYMYFYNGAGVGAGDFNGDGLVDLFFASNQGQNTLYLNEGHLHFRDVTEAAHIPKDGGWSTGVSIVDINGDGLLDIYVCKVGQFETLHAKNQFLICQGIDENGVPFFEDKAQEYRVDFSGFSTQAAFFDYDGDGDLDLFLLNHAVHQSGSFAERKKFLGTYHPLTGDRLYRNDKNYFTDVTKESGINSSAIGYGLGIAVADINLNGYPDLYIGNDFHENDYLYINNGSSSPSPLERGPGGEIAPVTFSEQLTQSTMHTSKFSMGVDIADINNDAFPEIISLDMLPSDPYILKRSLGEDEYNIFQMKLAYGYHPQYPQNALQLNRRNGLFSEVAMYAGVHATDWSWAPLWMDFNNDGWKDLFVSNGIPKRLNDIDYVNYISNDQMQGKIFSNKVDEQEMKVINNFPEIKLPNKFFLNKGNVSFRDEGEAIKSDQPTFSNGAIYADLDNDGDLDIVVNNINEPVILYENKTNKGGEKNFLELKLKGPAENSNALGAKAIVYARGQVRTYEKYPVRGFQSSMEIPLHIGLGDTNVDSILLIWPDNHYQKITGVQDTTFITLTYQTNLPLFDYTRLTTLWTNNTKPFQDITKAVNLLHKHVENPFVEFDREALMPFMVSRDGPALAVSDDLKDIFIGSSKGEKSTIFFQEQPEHFTKLSVPDLDKDSMYEDVDACWIDVNKDGFTDLVVASGGNEFYGTDEHLMPRVYLNNGRNSFKKSEGAFSNIFLTASCVVPIDFTGDGYPDLFIGGRAVPWEYGQVPQSYLLANDEKGHFTDVTAAYGKEISNIGFVKHAVPVDIDKDGDQDLILSLEWGGIVAFLNEKGHFVKKALTDKKGWWNFVLPVDVDGDGDLDLIAGNLGLNSRLHASPQQPVRMYFNDFDGNGKKEQVLTYYLQNKEVPFATKMDLEKQMPVLKKKFLYAHDFANTALTNLWPGKQWNTASVLTADYFSNAILINDGK